MQCWKDWRNMTQKRETCTQPKWPLFQLISLVQFWIILQNKFWRNPTTLVLIFLLLMDSTSKQLFYIFSLSLSLFSFVNKKYRDGMEAVWRMFPNEKKLVLWLGSSIGNLEDTEAVTFMQEIRYFISLYYYYVSLCYCSAVLLFFYFILFYVIFLCPF